MSMITAEHVRRLLDADEPEAALVIVEGAAKVSGRPEEEGGLVVTSRAELMRERTSRPDDHELDEIAQTLDATVSNLGG